MKRPTEGSGVLFPKMTESCQHLAYPVPLTY